MYFYVYKESKISIVIRSDYITEDLTDPGVQLKKDQYIKSIIDVLAMYLGRT